MSGGGGEREGGWERGGGEGFGGGGEIGGGKGGGWRLRFGEEGGESDRGGKRRGEERPGGGEGATKDCVKPEESAKFEMTVAVMTMKRITPRAAAAAKQVLVACARLERDWLCHHSAICTVGQ